MRRTLLLAALLASGATLLAQERATLIMNNGERLSGTLVSRTFATSSLSRSSVLLNVNNRNMQVPLTDVAVIDFAGGRPSTRELDDVARAAAQNGRPYRYDPNGRYQQPYQQPVSTSGQVIVMRDGTTMQGTLRNILRGDTVRWEYEPGDTDDFPIRNVARVYLSPDAGQMAYGYGGNAPYGSRSPYPTQVPTYGDYRTNGGYNAGYNEYGYGQLLSPPNGIAVSAATQWTDTGINVRAGDMISFAASGEIQWANGQTASPDGHGGTQSNNYPVTVMPVGGLIGKVGRSAAFPIGTNQNAIRMPANGRLLLGVNDDERGDNSGAFRVVIRSSR